MELTKNPVIFASSLWTWHEIQKCYVWTLALTQPHPPYVRMRSHFDRPPIPTKYKRINWMLQV